jgi:hypothetical protein
MTFLLTNYTMTLSLTSSKANSSQQHSKPRNPCIAGQSML